MACFGAKMRHIDDRCGIIGQNAQDLSGAQSLQAFARFQDRKGAKQPFGIKFSIISHMREVCLMFQFVHQLVTTWAVTLAASSLKQVQRTTKCSTLL